MAFLDHEGQIRGLIFQGKNRSVASSQRLEEFAEGLGVGGDLDFPREPFLEKLDGNRPDGTPYQRAACLHLAIEPIGNLQGGFHGGYRLLYFCALSTRRQPVVTGPFPQSFKV